MITPENSGASQTACNIVNATFLSLDGFAALRRDLDVQNQLETFAASIARVTDRELAPEDLKLLDEDQAREFCFDQLRKHSDQPGHFERIVDRVVDDVFNVEDTPDTVSREQLQLILNEIEFDFCN